MPGVEKATPQVWVGGGDAREKFKGSLGRWRKNCHDLGDDHGAARRAVRSDEEQDFN